jgi:hypothetical protein
MKNNIKTCYNKIKTGDIIGFYKSGIFSRLIERFSAKDEGVNVIHIGVVYNVKRDKEAKTVTFEISEQTATHGGVMTEYVIQIQDDKYTISNPHNYTDFFFKSLDKKFSNEQAVEGCKDAVKQKGGWYPFWTLPFSTPSCSAWLAKHGLAFLFDNSRVCSKHVMKNHEKAGREGATEFLAKNPNPTPKAVLNYNILDFKGKIFHIKVQ